MAPDGRSLITSVGARQRAVYVHDTIGERQISLEGYAYEPKLSQDGRTIFFRVLKDRRVSSPPLASSELWTADRESSRNEPFLPGFAVTGYDISRDGRRIVFSAFDAGGKNHLWLVPTDHRTAPHQVPDADGDMPLFGRPGELVFHAEGRTIFRVRDDGSERREAIPTRVDELYGVSPDGQWLIGVSYAPEYVTQAYPLEGGSPIRIGPFFPIRWQRDGKCLFISVSAARGTGSALGRTYALPLPRNQMFPRIPEGGFHSEREIATFPGARLVDVPPDFDPGPTPEVYAFSRLSVQRNLYRIPVP
jgi:dipeptidyl aminopeptidase/acylaminoacyl peptidase